MAVFTPQGVVKLIGVVPFNPSYENVVRFSSEYIQQSYFNSKTIDEIDEFTFIRKDSGIKVPVNIENLYGVNYVAYKNSGKWIYCFVTDKQYINDGTTQLTLEVDVFQTWLFQMNIRRCFVEREHVADDSFGKHLTEEGLDTGDFKRVSLTRSGHLENMSIVVALTADEELTSYYGNLYGGIYSGLYYFAVSADSGGVGAVNDLIQTLVGNGKGDRIISIFMCPTDFTTTTGASAKTYDISPSNRPTSIDGYTPRNNKLLTYPYTFLYVSNNNGLSATYKYEFMTNPDSPQFELTGDFSPSPTIFLIPKGYKGIGANYDEKLVLGNYPQCSWTSDIYAAWLASNRNTMSLGFANNALQAIGGIATGNIALTGMGVSGVIGQIAQMKDREIQPNQARGNTGGGGSTLAVGIHDFHFMPTTITREYAERIDNFFDMYGYKVNTVKTPNITGRPYWNYVKTNGSIVVGDIAMEDIQKIQTIFNNGVTIWHNPDNVGNYSLNNH